MKIRLAQTLLAGAACVWLAGAAAAQTSGIDVKDAWARATPGKAENGAVYLTIVAATPDKLIGASSPVAAKAELHRMEMAGSITKMRPVDGVDLPAGAPVSLKPGGVHIMLFGLKQPLQTGRHFPLSLQFAKAGTRDVDVTVEGVGAMGPQHDEHGGGMSMPMPAHR